MAKMRKNTKLLKSSDSALEVEEKLVLKQIVPNSDLCVKTSTLVPILKRLKDIDILRFKHKNIKKESLKRQPKNNEITKNLNNCDKNVTNPDDIEQKSIPLKIRILPEEQETRKESRNEVQHEE